MRIAALIVCISFAAAAPLSAKWSLGKKKDKAENERAEKKDGDSGQKSAKSSGMDTTRVPENPSAEKRVMELVRTIESKPTGLVVNNRGVVNAPPEHQPYNPDGSRNQNFQVNPDYSSGEAANLMGHEERVKAAKAEIIKIGKPGVPALCRALVNGGNEKRDFYAAALGIIGDPRAIPALLRYMEEGRKRVTMASTYRDSGATAQAAQMEKSGKKIMERAADSLSKISGESFGTDMAKWRAWWEANKARVGPTPNLNLFSANPR